MRATEFLEMMKQDTVTMSTADKELYGMVLLCMTNAVKGFNGEINGEKDLKGAYAAIKQYAVSIKNGDHACVDSIKATEIIRKYLGIPDDVQPSTSVDNVNLDDFI